MSTRSEIAILAEDGTVRAIYVHNYGQLYGVGSYLLRHYKRRADVEALLLLGDLSSIGKDVGSCHAYARDDGEPAEQTAAAVHVGLEAYLEYARTAVSPQYVYVYRARECAWEAYAKVYGENGNHAEDKLVRHVAAWVFVPEAEAAHAA